MGANAQTSVPVFTAGQILTAQQQTEINTGIPVFATTATRDAAFGGTGEKTLAEGQFAYIEATNATQYYDGTAWQSASGLTFITGATFTTVTSVSLPTNTFTSTYANYKVVFVLTAVTADLDLSVKLRASGVDTSSGYEYAYTGLTSGGAASNAAFAGGSDWSAAEADIASTYYTFNMDLFAPQLTQRTSFLATIVFDNKSAVTVSRSGGGFQDSATSFDSISFISNVASSITGNYKVYGYSNS